MLGNRVGSVQTVPGWLRLNVTVVILSKGLE